MALGVLQCRSATDNLKGARSSILDSSNDLQCIPAADTNPKGNQSQYLIVPVFAQWDPVIDNLKDQLS